VHDFFDVIGLPQNAPLGEVRRCARRPRRHHPDFRLTPDEAPPPPADHPSLASRVPRDVAVDFIDVGSLLDRIESHFFGRRR